MSEGPAASLLRGAGLWDNQGNKQGGPYLVVSYEACLAYSCFLN